MYAVLQDQKVKSSADKVVQNKLRPKKVVQKMDRTGLPDGLKSGIENLSGYRMDRVRVHYHSSKPAQFHALAYTEGTDIHVAQGQERHLPHEAWHVVQQMQGRVRPTMLINGVAANDNASLEHEADVMGRRAVQGIFSGGAPKGRTVPKGCLQARLPAGVDWRHIYQGIKNQGEFDDGNNRVRTIKMSKSLIVKLNRKSERNYVNTLEEDDGLRRLAYDIKSVKRAVKDSEPDFTGGNAVILQNAQNRINQMVKGTERTKYGADASYINQENNAHFNAMKVKARIMLSNAKGKSNGYLRRYFNPKRNALADENEFYRRVRDNMQKMINFLNVIDFKDNYSEIPGTYAYVHNESAPQPAGATVGGVDVGGTFVRSKMHGGNETGLKIRLSSAYRQAPENGQDSKPGTIVHEASHMILGTEDYEYGDGIFTLDSDKAVNNADTYEYAVEKA